MFAANHVPLRNGDNSTITAYAFNDSGDNATDSVSVIADTTSNYLTLSSNPESGIVSGTAPLDFTLSLSKTYSRHGYSFSYDPDNGSIENRGDNGTTMKFERRVAEPELISLPLMIMKPWITEPACCAQTTSPSWPITEPGLIQS